MSFRTIRFHTYSLQIDPTFWATLYDEKLKVWKLDDEEKSCTATVSNGTTLLFDRSSIQPSNNQIIQSNQGNIHEFSPSSNKMIGTLRVFNVRNDLLNYHKKERKAIEASTNNFVFLIHADLKDYSFDYFFALPTHYPSSPFTARLEANIYRNRALIEQNVSVFHVPLIIENEYFILPWMVRNRIFTDYQQGIRRFQFKNNGNNVNNAITHQLYVQCHDLLKTRYTGWSSPTVSTVKLSQTMDPRLIAEQNAHLNLRLMMWKHEPTLPIEKLRNMKCLLLGSGTVGCAIARNLISWGVQNIDFVDCATVSHSNPVRQNLYTTSDYGKEKAKTASENIKNILPSMISSGYTLDIPMPGHAFVGNEEDYLVLENLISKCDVVFLSTDSREGRWLPILLSKLHDKILINIALGYESLLVQYTKNDNSCYFCADPIAPRDSVSSRTIDQKCTITRPGISTIASAIAVEMFVDIVKGLHENDQIRFHLSDMNFQRHPTVRNEKCCCCSIEMISEITEKGYRFVEEIKCDPSILEYLSDYNDNEDDAVSLQDYKVDSAVEEEEISESNEFLDVNLDEITSL